MQAPGTDSSSQRNILLVDDNRMGRLARKTVLTENGYNVTVTERPDQVLALLAKEPFHLVVTGYKMAKMLGTEVIAQMRSAGFEQPVILMAGYVDGLSLNEATTGANMVIQKSANEVPRLVHGVRTLLQPRKAMGKAKATTVRERRKA